MLLPNISHRNTEIELTIINKEAILKFSLQNLYSNSDAIQYIPSISLEGRSLSSLFKEAVTQESKIPQINTLLPSFQSYLNNIAELANSLKQALSVSGHFYESHQAQWLVGKRSFEQLQQEPQSKFVNTDSNHGINQLILQQLMILETGQVVWKGEIWPGQLINWEVMERNDTNTQQEVERDLINWVSRLNINLPYLGQIDITLYLSRLGASIHIKTKQDITNNLLEINQFELVKAIETGNIKVHSISVKKDNDESSNNF